MTGSNFKPGSKATFTLHSEPVVLGTAVVAANGTVSLTAKLPANIPAGVHTLVISGTGTVGGAVEASIKVTVAAAGSTTAATKPATKAPATTAAGDKGAGDLANTGAGTTPFLLGGLVLLVAGALAVFSRRRRNSSHA